MYSQTLSYTHLSFFMKGAYSLANLSQNFYCFYQSFQRSFKYKNDPINLYIEPIFSLIPCKKGIIAVPIPTRNVINAESHMLSFFSIQSF